MHILFFACTSFESPHHQVKLTALAFYLSICYHFCTSYYKACTIHILAPLKHKVEKQKFIWFKCGKKKLPTNLLLKILLKPLNLISNMPTTCESFLSSLFSLCFLASSRYYSNDSAILDEHVPALRKMWSLIQFLCWFYRAFALQQDYGGDSLYMKLHYGSFAPLLLYLIEWMDYSCTDSVISYLGLLQILVYQVRYVFVSVCLVSQASQYDYLISSVWSFMTF